MPFKSEAQRRYLWANEPEIARDWTDTYGSRIHKDEGGIARIGFFSGMREQEQKEKASKSSAAGSKQPGHGGSSLTPAYHAPQAPIQQGPHIGEGSKLHTTAPGTLSDPREKEDYFEQSWSGQPGIFGIGGGYKTLKTPGVTAGGHQSNFGIGNLFKGAASMFGGLPATIGSFMGGLGNNFFQGRGDYANQAAWEQAKQNRINQKRRARRRKYRPEIPQNIDQGRGSGLRSTVDDVEEFNFADLIKRLDTHDFENVDFNKQGIASIADSGYIPGNFTGTTKDNYWDKALDMEAQSAGLLDFWKKDKGINEAEMFGEVQTITHNGKTYEIPSKIYPSKGSHQLEGEALERYIEKNNALKQQILESPDMLPDEWLVGEDT